MFWILLIIGLAGCVISIYFAVVEENKRSLAMLCLVVSFGTFLISWKTPQGHMYLQQLIASGQSGNWLVVDNSGGETMRHWVLKDAYVGSSDQSDGWKFFDSKGNGPIYVSGDSFVMRIKEPMEKFMETYQTEYNIPSENKMLE